MSRAKTASSTASRRKTSPEQKIHPENSGATTKPSQPKNKKNDSEKNAGSKSAFGYDVLAQQTLDLWRDQLAHFLNNPDAMKDAGKTAEPVATLLSPQISQMFSPLFSGGMDLWLMMLEQLGKAANMNTPMGNMSGSLSGGAAGNEYQKNRSTQQSGNAHRASPSAALSGASTYAVAQLASRIADLEKRFAEFENAGKPAAKKSSGKKKAAAGALEALKGAAAKSAKRKR